MATEAQDRAPPEPPADPKQRFRAAPVVKFAIAIALIGVGCWAGWRYWHHGQLFASTDNAYVGAHVVQIAALVPGPVARLYVEDLHKVAAGDPLFDIDPESYELALNEANAILQFARQSVDQESAGVQVAEAVQAQRRAELEIAQSDERRTRDLVTRKFLSEQVAETARSKVKTAAATLAAADADLQRARSALGQQGPDNAAIHAAISRVEKATLDLRRTHVVAPASGLIVSLTLREGSTVQAMTPLFAIIDDREYWVDANFKETELERLRAGQHATIELDMYPHHRFAGVVQEISGGSGTAFSLLPAQNATGNWVKVTQRVPVRIRFEAPDANYPLRVGTSANVEVRVR